MSQAGILNSKGGGGGGSNVQLLTGNVGGAVPPTSNNINVIGSGAVLVTGNPATSTLTITVAASVATTYTENTGTATPAANNLNILGTIAAAGTSPLTTSGAGSTVTITTQYSQAIAATNATNVGLAAFNSAQFTVDGNGFVSVNGSGIGEVITGMSGGPLSPVAGNWNIFGASVVAGGVPVTTSGSGNTLTVQVQQSKANASSSGLNAGIASFNSANFTVDGNGFVSTLAPSSNYTNVTHAMSPYTVLLTDSYISVDVSGGVVTLNFPNAPVFKQQWIIKDRTGNAAVSNITITTPGGTVTIDGLTSYIMNSNFQAIQILANATPTYEVF
jgi:hypothetical protein